MLTPTQLWAWATTYGLPGATAYLAPERDRGELITSAWLVATVVNVPLVALVWFLVPAYLAGHDPITVGWFRIILVGSLLSLPCYTTLNHLNGVGRNAAFNALRHLPTIGNAVAVLVLRLSGRLSLASALRATLITNVVGCAAAILFGRGWPRRFRLSTLRAQWRFGSRLAIGQLASLAVGRLDQLLMVRLVSSAQLGRYAVAATAAGAGGALAQGLAFALFPRVRHAETARLRRREVRRASRWVLVGSGAMALAIGAIAPYLLPALFGAGFRDAVPALWLLLPGQVANDRATVLAAGLQASGRPGVATRGQLLATMCTAAGIVPAVARWGIQGAAVVTSLSQLAGLIYVSRQNARLKVSALTQTV